VHIEGKFNEFKVKSHDEIAEIFSHNDVSLTQSKQSKSIFHSFSNDMMVPEYILELNEQIDFLAVIDYLLTKSTWILDC
jgi:hypothetical protein